VKIVIVGAGRVGSVLAEAYDAAGHEVVILDLSTKAFDRLPAEFGGKAIRGDGTDEDTLRRAGAADADIFLALTEGDNRNVMAAQVATEKLGIDKVVAKINDPVRASAYGELGIATLCRTTLQADAISAYLGFATLGIMSVVAPTGSHHGGMTHQPLGADAPVVAGAAGREG
jgi:trk system potassium uptake protein TrkA